MEEIPKNPKTYKGNQVIINSDRLVFNAKQDSILLYAEKSMGFSTTGNFHFDTDNTKSNKFIVNAPRIYLGLKNQDKGDLPEEPAVLGKELKSALEDILNLINMILIDIDANITYVAGDTLTSPGPYNETIINDRQGELELIKNSLNNIMSKNVFIAKGNDL